MGRLGQKWDLVITFDWRVRPIDLRPTRLNCIFSRFSHCSQVKTRRDPAEVVYRQCKAMFGLGPHKTYYAYSQAAWWTSFMTIFLQRLEPTKVPWYTRFRKWNDKETKEADKKLHLLLNSLFVTVFRLTLGVGMSPVWFAIITCGEVRAEGPLA